MWKNRLPPACLPTPEGDGGGIRVAKRNMFCHHHHLMRSFKHKAANMLIIFLPIGI